MALTETYFYEHLHKTAVEKKNNTVVSNKKKRNRVIFPPLGFVFCEYLVTS